MKGTINELQYAHERLAPVTPIRMSASFCAWPSVRVQGWTCDSLRLHHIYNCVTMCNLEHAK